MKKEQIIRSWKDAEYRTSLGEASAALPENPAGVVALDDEALGAAAGADTWYIYILSWGCCAGLSKTEFCPTYSGNCLTDEQTCGYVCAKTGSNPTDH